VVTGSFSGSCTGTIRGNYAGGNEGAINGTADGTCKVALINQDIKAKYNGKVYLKDGRADLSYEGNMGPLWNSGSQTVTFSADQ
jgi:hypothetical protein